MWIVRSRSEEWKGCSEVESKMMKNFLFSCVIAVIYVLSLLHEICKMYASTLLRLFELLGNVTTAPSVEESLVGLWTYGMKVLSHLLPCFPLSS